MNFWDSGGWAQRSICLVASEGKPRKFLCLLKLPPTVKTANQERPISFFSFCLPSVYRGQFMNQQSVIWSSCFQSRGYLFHLIFGYQLFPVYCSCNLWAILLWESSEVTPANQAPMGSHWFCWSSKLRWSTLWTHWLWGCPHYLKLRWLLAQCWFSSAFCTLY